MPYSQGTTDDENENDDERTETFQELSPQNMKKFKMLTVFVTFFIFIMVVTVPSMSLEQVDCIKDSVTDFFTPQYHFFLEHHNLKCFLQIASGLLSDFVFLYFTYNWTINFQPKTWRLPIALFLAHITRIFFVLLFKIRAIKDSQWSYPGIYSLTVSYH